ncbi:MAG: hypothetical protein Q8888_01715 [Vigna little leaf phytoplasma]|nr:hypothetical protein [Vigna little leaf phytoplasma]
MSFGQPIGIKSKIFFNFFKSIACLFIALAFYFNEKFKIGNFQLYNIFSGLIIFLISYFLVFDNFKKNSGTIKYFFALENIILIFIGLGVIFQPLIKNDSLRNFFHLNYIIYYILIVHNFIELFVMYSNKQKKTSNLKFIFYLILLILISFLLGKKFKAIQIVLKCISVFFMLAFLFYLLIVCRLCYSKKNTSN